MTDKFIEAIFADISSPITLLFILVVSVYFLIRFIFKNWGQIKSYFENAYQTRKKREELYETVESLKQAKNDLVSETNQLITETKTLSKAQKDSYNEQLKYRTVSQELRDKLQKKTDEAVEKSEEANTRSKETLSEIRELRLIVEKINARQEEIDADRKAQKVNELRKDLIDAYHHFGSVAENPKQTWNEMEAHAFWSMFNDYERYGGNDFAHQIIQPAMNRLKVIPITEDTEED